MVSAVICLRLQPLHPSHLIVTSTPDLRPLRGRGPDHILRGMQIRSNDPNAPPLIFGGVLEEVAYPLARRLLQGRMKVEIVWSQAPNKVLMVTPPPIDPTEQLLPQSYRSALSQLRSDYCSRLQSYRHSVSRLGRWPHLPRLPLHLAHGGHTVYLSLYLNFFFSLVFKFIICIFFVSLRCRHDCCEIEKLCFFINIDNHLSFLHKCVLLTA